MGESNRRTTIYLDPATHRALKMKAAASGRSFSELVNEAIVEMLRQDHDDLRAFSERIAEPVMTYGELLEGLKADGKL